MAQHIESGVKQAERRKIKFENGKLYFSTGAERKFYFILTLIMLLLGACVKLGGLL